MTQTILKKIKWHRLVSRGRNHAILIIDAVGVAGQKDYARKIYNIPCRVDFYRQFNGSRWISERDYLSLNKTLDQVTKKNPKFLYQFGVKMEKEGHRIMEMVDRYKNKDWAGSLNRELVNMLASFQDLIGRLWGGGPQYYCWYFYFNESYLEKLKNHLEHNLKNDFEQVWQYTIQPEKLTFIGQEKLALLKLARKFITAKKIPQKHIKDHLEKFAFVNKYYFGGEGFTYSQIEDALRKIIKVGEKKISRELSSFKILKLNLNRFPLSANEKWIIKGFKKMAYASNLGDEVSNYYTFHMGPLFNEIARRLDCFYEELVSMRFQEIKESLESGKLIISRKELKERYKDHALIFGQNKAYVISGKDLVEYRRNELKEEEIKTDIKQFKGNVAFKSNELVKGNVMIIESNEQVSSFKNGMILVTQMTNPTYLPAMKKSKAIVTDEGGLLCHAAIVSRELRIPCIIGTKIATKVLNNKDFIEVDANKGFVKILKKAK